MKKRAQEGKDKTLEELVIEIKSVVTRVDAKEDSLLSLLSGTVRVVLD